MNIIYKKIEEKDKEKIECLKQEVITGIERQEFYMEDPEEDKTKMFENTIFYGAYDNDNLVGLAQLYIDQEYLEDMKEIFGLKRYSVCELGTALVKKEYRNQGIMQNLIKIQIDIAKDMKFEYIIATIHPENIPSNRAFEKSGFHIKGQAIFRENYLRNLCVMKI